MKSIDVEARSVAEAIEKALELLKTSREEIDIKVLSEGKMGLFGMEGGKLTKIRVTVKKKKP